MNLWKDVSNGEPGRRKRTVAVCSDQLLRLFEASESHLHATGDRDSELGSGILLDDLVIEFEAVEGEAGW